MSFHAGDRVRRVDSHDESWGTVRNPREHYTDPDWREYAEDLIELGLISVEWDDGKTEDGFLPEELMKLK